MLRWIVIGVAASPVACGMEERPVTGDYALSRLDTIFYLVDTRTARSREEPGGVFGGVVERIGWNDTHVVAAIERGGWKILDVKGHRLSHVLSETEALDALRTRPELRGIVLRPAGETWHKLPLW